jgi:cardiolipin synthase
MIASWAWTTLLFVDAALVLWASLHMLTHHREPRGMIAWILAMLLLPLLGVVLYALIGPVPLQHKVRRRRRRLQRIEHALARRIEVLGRRDDAETEPHLDARQRSLVRLAARASNEIVTRGNDVIIYHESEPVFPAMTAAIESAAAHVHLQYFIFSADETGRAIRDLLARKAREGVEVRLLLDAVGCWRMPRSFLRPLRDAGARVEFFMPWGFTTRRFNVNCRNHRKLVVIDGCVGFMGSQNIGDEYRGRRRKYGPWRDTHMRVDGPCVLQLQEVFVEDWYFAADEDLSADQYFPEPRRRGDRLVQIVASGPDRRPDAMYFLLCAAVNDAAHSISIMTPYFVPDQAIMVTLASAALRGVTVRLLVPSASDQWLVKWAGRASYEALLESSIEVYEYDHGMLHSKVVIVDKRWSMVGSANMLVWRQTFRRISTPF